MNIFMFIILLTILLVSTLWIIPKYTPEDKQVMIKDWVGLGFSGLLLIIALIESRLQDTSLAFPVIFYGLVLTLCLTGVYWWIPAYIPAAEQNTAISYLFNSVTFSLLLANQLSPSLRPGYSYTQALTAGRKR